MAKHIRTSVNIESKTTLILTEEEVKALDGIFGYNVDNFLKVFYEKMGKCYVEPYEAGVRSLHKTIRSELSPAIQLIDKARTQLHLTNVM